MKTLRITHHPNAIVARFHNRRVLVEELGDGSYGLQFHSVLLPVWKTGAQRPPVGYFSVRNKVGYLALRISPEALQALASILSHITFKPMAKPTNRQALVIQQLKQQCDQWLSTNDIHSPSHASEVNDELILLELDNVITSEEQEKLSDAISRVWELIASLDEDPRRK